MTNNGQRQRPSHNRHGWVGQEQQKKCPTFFWQPRGAHSPTAELRRDRIFSRVANFLAARLALFPAYGLVQQAYFNITTIDHEKKSAKRSGCEKKLAGKKEGKKKELL